MYYSRTSAPPFAPAPRTPSLIGIFDHYDPHRPKRGPALSVMLLNRPKPYPRPPIYYKDKNETSPTVTAKQKAKFERFRHQKIQEFRDNSNPPSATHAKTLELYAHQRFKYLKLLNDELDILRKECIEMMIPRSDLTSTTEDWPELSLSSPLEMDIDLEMLSKVCERKVTNMYEYVAPFLDTIRQLKAERL
jgi:hypothetical protein